MDINWTVALNWVPTTANIIACIAVGWMLWIAYGRAWSVAKTALATVGAAVLGFIVYFAVQAVLEDMVPQTRINGHIVVYNINLFAPVLAVVIVAIFALRKMTTLGASRNVEAP